MNKKKSKNFVNARLRHIMERPQPDYPVDRANGSIFMDINGVETIVELRPAKNITQWYVTINGLKLTKPMGMNHIYRELARLNPPARNFF